MPYRNKQMLRDANGDLIPQYWDVVAGDFKPLTGSDGAQDTRLTGSIVEKLQKESNFKIDGNSEFELFFKISNRMLNIFLKAQYISSTDRIKDNLDILIYCYTKNDLDFERYGIISYEINYDNGNLISNDNDSSDFKSFLNKKPINITGDYLKIIFKNKGDNSIFFVYSLQQFN